MIGHPIYDPLNIRKFPFILIQPQEKPSPKPRAIATKNHSKSMAHDGIPAPKRSRHTLVDRNFVGDNDLSFTNNTPRRNDAVNQLLNRPQLLVNRPEPEEINMNAVSETLKAKSINPSPMRFGFLGLGIMGSGIVKNLLDSGHKVVIWNRTSDKCRKFEEIGAEIMATPCDVIDSVDITFSCVADPTVAKQMVFGNCGVLSSSSLVDGKGFVEMTSIDPETSQDIFEGISAKGGRYLEAQVFTNLIIIIFIAQTLTAVNWVFVFPKNFTFE